MKKLLIIPISILLLTACAKVEAPTVTTTAPLAQNVKPEEQKVTQDKKEKTSDGWIKSGNTDTVVSYTGKEITLKGKVVEREYYNEWKYFFDVIDDSTGNLPAELAKEITEKEGLRYFSLYFKGKDVTNNYKNKEITIAVESIGVLAEGNPHIQLKKLP